MGRDQFESEMNRGFLQLLTLHLLEEKLYGYEIVQRMEKMGYCIEESSLYPLLRRLASKGLLESDWQVVENKPRKYYVISKEGKQVREEINAVWEKQNQILNRVKEGAKDA
ncbi:MAG TPA: helix-turn-helix transcriptional regulator [Thermotogota bacterium]|nr:helix-turn-helix transcriptional regulator [Thermotogota bacterium]HRW93334.1 helix-turn-helix transcriptional regulator [Thermotogota bacterium]